MWILFLFTPGILLYEVLFKKEKRHWALRIPWYFSNMSLILIISSLILCLFKILSIINIIFSILIFDILIISIYLIKNKLSPIDLFNKLKTLNFKRFSDIPKFLTKIKSKNGIFLAGIIFLVLIIMNLILLKWKYPQTDVYPYFSRVLSLMEYDINIFDYISFYVDSISATRYYVYLLIPILYPFKNNPEFMNIILKNLIPSLHLISFILIIYLINKKILKTNFMMSVGIFLASYHLTTWICFSIPSALTIIFILIVFIDFYSTEFKNLKSGMIALFNIFILHRPSFLILIIILIISNQKVVIRFLKVKIRLNNFLKNKKFFKISTNYLVLSIFLIMLIIIGIITGLFSYILSIYSITINGSFISRYIVPFPSMWIFESSGILILILCLYFGKVIYKKNNDNIDNYLLLKNLYNYFIYLVIICLILPIWAFLTALPYMYYRYFIYIDLCMIIIAPISYKFLSKKIISTTYKKIKTKNVLKIFQISIILQISIFSILHINSSYYFDYTMNQVKDEHIDAYYWLSSYDSGNNSLIFVPSFPTANLRRDFPVTIFYDKYIINLNECNEVFQEMYEKSLIEDDYLGYFKNYLNNSVKTLERTGLSINNSKSMINAPIKYLIIDSYYNATIYSEIRKDPFFKEIYFTNVVDESHLNVQDRITYYYNLSIFLIS